MLVKTSIHSVPRPLTAGGNRRRTQHEALCAVLSDLLADTYGLYQQCLYYFWNVASDAHLGLEATFEKQCDMLEHSGRQIKECLVEAGCLDGHPAHIPLPSFPQNRSAVTSVGEMFTNILKGHEACSRKALAAMYQADQNHEAKIASFMLQIMLMHDKAAWMIKSLYA